MTAIVAEPAASAPAARRRSVAPRTRAGASRVLGVLGSVLLVAAALALLAMTVGPRVFGYRTATMLTGSMVPTIDPGDMIVDLPQRASAIAIGQIISYQIPVDDHRVESHRVVWVGRGPDATIEFRTQGDANDGADPWTAQVAATDQVWRVAHVVRRVGDVIRFLRGPAVQLVLTRALPVALVGWLLVAIWRRPAPSAQRAAGENGAGEDTVRSDTDAEAGDARTA